MLGVLLSQENMSNFEGYMGGDPGQGYNSQDSIANANANANAMVTSTANYTNAAQAHPPGGVATPTFAAPPQPNETMQAPNSAGSITKFYQQDTRLPAPFASPPVSYSGAYPNANNTFQHQQPGMMQTQHQQYQYQSVPVPYHQQAMQHSFPSQPTAMPGTAPLYAQHANQPNHPQQQQQQSQQPQPALAYSQSIAQQQRIPNQLNQSHLTPQPQAVPVSTSAAAGSYAARSAQVYATIGTSSPSPQPVTSAIPTPNPNGPTVGPQQQPPAASTSKYDDTPANQAQQNRILTDCTRKVQEHAYYMKQAMDKDELSVVLDRAAQMVGELGDSSSGMLTPKNYYELHMRALDDMPNLEEYFISLTAADDSKYTMRNLYDYVQYCPRVLSRLYIQISAGSALIRSKEESATSVLNELIEAVRCVQNPLRGLFLRHFLLQVTRDKLPDGEQVRDAYEFVLTNFIEMNRLWVRIQHLPGDGKSKEQRKRRERERNELRILVGTNLVRLSQLEGVTSQVYGEKILPRILEQIIACGDPLAQAYLMDCIIQVFPDEYHIETLPILLAVCPKLRDKVNVRTIMQSLMDRLANYYADEELLDEVDTNEVKKSVARDSFQMFEECVQKVFQARGPKLVSREVIRLQTALLTFSLKCFPGNMEQVSRCLGICVDFIRQAANASAVANQTPLLEDFAIHLDEVSVTELEKMLSIPLDSLALKVLELEYYSDLLQFLPWKNRHDVGMIMLRAIDTSGVAPRNVNEVEELFSILLPVIQDKHPKDDRVGGDGVQERDEEGQEEENLVSKLVHLLDHENAHVAYDMVFVARSHLGESGSKRIGSTLTPVVFSALRLANRIAFEGEKACVQRDSATVSDPDDDGSVDGDSKNEPGDVVGATEGDEIEEVEPTDPNGIESPWHLAVMEENPAPPVETLPPLRYVPFLFDDLTHCALLTFVHQQLSKGVALRPEYNRDDIEGKSRTGIEVVPACFRRC